MQNCSQVLYACISYTSSHQLPVARPPSRNASLTLQPWRYEKQEAMSLFKWVEIHTLALAEAHSNEQAHVTSVTLRVALMHVLQAASHAAV